jgi:hypothetical protein
MNFTRKYWLFFISTFIDPFLNMDYMTIRDKIRNLKYDNNGVPIDKLDKYKELTENYTTFRNADKWHDSILARAIRFIVTLSIFLSVLALFVSLLYRCADKSESDKVNEANQFVNEITATVTIDGCEYILIKYNGRASITHKGNCKFCNKRIKQ